jgi:hypothetical protein
LVTKHRHIPNTRDPANRSLIASDDSECLFLSPLARREVVVGALWPLMPFIGWLLNMGHRIVMTYRMQRSSCLASVE